MRLLHVKIRGWTAAFRIPFLYSGPALTSPVPPYSTLLGILGNIAGREIKPDETRIGFIFKSDGRGVDLETTQRFEVTKKGILKEKKERGIVKREFLVNPELDLFLNNLSFKKYFELPANTLSLGRSQDSAWIELVEEVGAKPINAGSVRGCLVPFPQKNESGLILRFTDGFENSKQGYVRSAKNPRAYIVAKYDSPIKMEAKEDLFQLETGETIYMHNLS